MAVWGAEYVDMFLNLCLPNQLTPGNLKVFKNGPEAVYIIYTRPEDVLSIKENRFYRELTEVMKTEIHTVDFIHSLKDGIEAMALVTKCHKRAIPESNKEDARIVFLPPDQVYSEGTFQRLIEIAATGKRFVGVAGMRLDRKTFRPAFQRSFRGADGYTQAASRPLVKLALSHLHPMAQSWFFDSDRCNADMNQLYFKVEGSGIVARCLVVHPLMMWPLNKTAVPEGTFDGDYPIKACPNFKDYYIVNDSDDIMAFELSPAHRKDGIGGERKFNIYNYSALAKHGYNRIHNRYVRETIRIHYGEITSEWEKVERKADSVIRKFRIVKVLSKNYKKQRTLFPSHRHVIPLDHVKRVVIFGTGYGAKLALNLANKCKWQVMYFTDNNPGLSYGLTNGAEVRSPSSLAARDFDLIIVASMPGKKDIMSQLENMGLRYQEDYIYFFDAISVDNVQMMIKLRKTADA